MMDNASLVGKLRDIHPPASDGAMTMITMSLLGAITATVFAIYFYHSWRNKQESFGKALARLEYSRESPAADRVVVQARVLREVVESIDPAAALLHGEAWLSQLDEIFITNFFSQGAGRIFGEDLYKPVSIAVADSLDTELGHLLARLKHVRD